MTTPAPTADAEKRRAALSSILWALFLTCIKIVAGIATNSLGILSEALHSGLDLVAAGITYFAVRVAAKPADKQHPYGHGKVENLSALVETVLLLVTCGWIVREAVERLFFSAPEIEPSWWGAGVIAVSLIVDINRSRMLHRVAKKHKSQALEADALHFTTDIWSSGVVLIGLLCVQIGAWLPQDHVLAPLLHMADAVAALFVSVIVVMVGIRLSRRAVDALLDGGGLLHTGPIEEALTAELPGHRITRLRVRESGAEAFVDLTVTAPASLPLEAAHDLTENIEKLVHKVLPEADVTVHVEPEAPHHDAFLDIARTVAASHRLAIHNLSLFMHEEQLLLFLHAEVPPEMPLVDAHARVDAFENALAQRLGPAEIVTHIEPEAARHTNACAWAPLDDAHLRDLVLGILPDFPAVSEIQHLRIYALGEAPLLSFRCLVDPNLTVAAAHELASNMEYVLRTRAPEFGRITIHTDPRED